MKLADIKMKYRDKAKGDDGDFLLEPDDAIAFIDDCVAAGFTLLGVEGFSVFPEGGIQPHQEHSNDIYYATGTPDEFVEETKAFIRQRRGSGICFEIVFSE